ncbi:MAG: CAP domain-containing protein [Candidatus Staskawiczbacteria bacterium]|nr:CAP domain-containing protein [Candidatus Staskawiczbacteria bacterium]
MKSKTLLIAIISTLILLSSTTASAATNVRTQELINRAHQRIAQMQERISQLRNNRNLSTTKLNTARNVTPPVKSEPVQTQASGELVASKIIEYTNWERQKYGLSPLSQNSKLSSAALKKAQDMLSNQYFAHVSPNGTGLVELINSVGYNYSAIAENLAYGNFKTESEVIKAWMASPGHRAAILNKNYTEIGAAIVKGTYQGRTVWMAVQEFGAPAK